MTQTPSMRERMLAGELYIADDPGDRRGICPGAMADPSAEHLRSARRGETSRDSG